MEAESKVEEQQEQQEQQVQQVQQVKKEHKLVEVEVTNENVALNMMVSFLGLANKRGAFSIDESAKIWECISKFNRN